MTAESLKRLLSDTFLQGLAAGLAELHRMHGSQVEIVDVLNGFGVTIDDLKAARVEAGDIAELRLAVA